MNQSMSTQSSPYWIVVPAAGVGARMGASCPKQYLPLGKNTVIEITLERLLTLPDVAGIALVLSEEDEYWEELLLSRDPRIHRVIGGRERCDSVLNALDFLAARTAPNDWVLVHDAARPCVHTGTIQNLVAQVKDHAVGGILGVPVSDTLKQVDEGSICATADRSSLWHAQTPQMFRIELLRQCLRNALAQNKVITDEASAVEVFGYQPLMVLGRSDNIKITRPEDLAIAAVLIQLA
jgi:2-C-methyl-D-erythritol 4-phosphate cytidylyltransferase